jgi:hypothetical protein
MDTDTGKIVIILGILLVISAVILLVYKNNSEKFSDGTITHPGFMVSKTRLEKIKYNVNNKIEPHYTAFNNLIKSPYADLNYIPKGPPSDGYIRCGSYERPNIGCSHESVDSAAAVIQAVLWIITENRRYAENSINIMNRYSKVYKGHKLSNSILQASWTMEKFPVAAEIIRYSNAGWKDDDFDRFKNMLNKYVSEIRVKNSSNGNWMLSKIHGLIGISIVTANTRLYKWCVKKLIKAIPAYVYHESDGRRPEKTGGISTNWNGQRVFNKYSSGVSQETCRDLGHTQMGLSSMFGALEACYIQGDDLYGRFEKRLVETVELHSRLMNKEINKNICNGKRLASTNWTFPTFEIAYNALSNRMGNKMPATMNYIENRVRKLTYDKFDNRYHHNTILETLLTV